MILFHLVTCTLSRRASLGGLLLFGEVECVRTFILMDSTFIMDASKVRRINGLIPSSFLKLVK